MVMNAETHSRSILTYIRVDPEDVFIYEYEYKYIYMKNIYIYICFKEIIW